MLAEDVFIWIPIQGNMEYVVKLNTHICPIPVIFSCTSDAKFIILSQLHYSTIAWSMVVRITYCEMHNKIKMRKFFIRIRNVIFRLPTVSCMHDSYESPTRRRVHWKGRRWWRRHFDSNLIRFKRLFLSRISIFSACVVNAFHAYIAYVVPLRISFPSKKEQHANAVMSKCSNAKNEFIHTRE